MPSDRVFLFSSETENPDRFFQGYFFHEADYIFGSAGFEEFRETRGVERLVREDGCYVEAEKTPNGYRFSSDYNGYKKLFYYWNRGFWVVSNSLRRISLHLREHDYPVLADVPQVAAMATEGTFYPSGRGSFFSQLPTLDTIVQGVRLVPAHCALHIGPAGGHLERTPCPGSPATYENRLGRFLSIWFGRLSVLANDPAVQISCDLTGGLDSRAVFGLLVQGARDRGPAAAERLQICSSGPGIGARKDRAVAARICEAFGLPLNAEPAKHPRWLDGDTAYRLWQDLCLGAYHPIYFPNAFTSARIVHLRGGGGENHRPFYGRFLGAPSADTFVAKRARLLAPRAARPKFEHALQHALDSIMEGAPKGLDPLTCHYRNFRDRFHAGLHPQYGVTVQPLASKLLDEVTAAAGARRFRDRQVHYDILHNLAPGLLELPFDSLRKRPRRAVRQRLTTVTAHPCPPGDCFIGEPDLARKKRDKKRQKRKIRPIDRLHEEFSHAKHDYPSKLLGKTYVRRAERILEAAARKGELPGPTASKRISVVMACAMFGRGDRA